MNTATDTTGPRTAPLPNRLPIALLTLSAFVAITTEYGIIGIMPELAQGLGVSTTTAGQLVTLFAVTVMLSGPFLTALLAGKKRKPLFISVMVIYAVANLIAALAPNFATLAIARILPALALPVFWGTASETAVQLAGPGNAGRASAQFYLGSACALLIGIPFGTLISHLLGWRALFGVLALLSLITAAAHYYYMPTLEKPLKFRLKEQLGILKKPYFLINLLLSVVVFTAMFTAYTYFAHFLQKVAGVSDADVGWWLLGFGAIGLVGNWLGGKFLDRSLLRTTIFFLSMLGGGMTLSTLMASQPILLWIALAMWGIAYTALFPVCQVRVVAAAQRAKALAGTMNVSATNGGTALGSMIGGAIVAQWGIGILGFAATLIALLGVWLTWQTIKMKRRYAIAPLE
ncbi:MFS transporter [Carnimonas bestiolae]|uniref:MFS transporter n=1 Tax=Carnimonas bestiolae TaxID=3402172 RepID=UPI003EDC3082